MATGTKGAGLADGKSDIVISGAGLVSSLGVGREATWSAVRAGEVGLGPYTQIEDPEQADRGGGEVRLAEGLSVGGAGETPREAALLRLAIDEALRHAGLEPAEPAGWGVAPARCGVMLGTTLHGMTAAGKMVRSGSAMPLRDFLAPAVLARATAHLRLEGFAATTCSACSSGLGSLLLAVTLLRSGELDLVVAGGYDPISEYAYAGFNSLRLVDDRLPRPFARDRAGMKVSEGYGVLIVERADDARRRGSEPFLVFRGGGESADAHHLTQPMQDGSGAARAIRGALSEAGLEAGGVDLVVAHATGTPDNDAAEVAALGGVLGDRLKQVPTVGLKSRLGHTLGGAGAAELILAGLALRDRVCPTTASTAAGDVDFESLRLATGKPAAVEADRRWRTTLNTSLGFGGANTCVVASGAGGGAGSGDSVAAVVVADASKPREQTGARPAWLAREVWVTGVGVVLPGVVGRSAWAEHLRGGGRVAGGGVDEGDYLPLLNARRVRRLSDYVKLTLAAANLALDDAAVEATERESFTADCAGLLGTAHGSTRYSYDYYRGIVDQGLSTANPMLFAEGVPNAGAAHLSMSLKLRGACQSIIGSRTAGLDALRLASLRIAEGALERCVVCAGEEHDPLVEPCYAELGLPMQTCGAAVGLVLESRASAEGRGLSADRVAGEVLPGRSVHYGGRLGRGVSAVGELLAEACGGPAAAGTLWRVGGSGWLERFESAALRRAEARCGGGRVGGMGSPAFAQVMDLARWVPECFSAGPLLAVAGHLVGGAMKRRDQGPDATAGDAGKGPDGSPTTAGVLAGDFNGLASFIRIRRGIH